MCLLVLWRRKPSLGCCTEWRSEPQLWVCVTRKRKGLQREWENRGYKDTDRREVSPGLDPVWKFWWHWWCQLRYLTVGLRVGWRARRGVLLEGSVTAGLKGSCRRQMLCNEPPSIRNPLSGVFGLPPLKHAGHADIWTSLKHASSELAKVNPGVSVSGWSVFGFLLSHKYPNNCVLSCVSCHWQQERYMCPKYGFKCLSSYLAIDKVYSLQSG